MYQQRCSLSSFITLGHPPAGATVMHKYILTVMVARGDVSPAVAALDLVISLRRPLRGLRFANWFGLWCCRGDRRALRQVPGNERQFCPCERVPDAVALLRERRQVSRFFATFGQPNLTRERFDVFRRGFWKGDHTTPAKEAREQACWRIRLRVSAAVTSEYPDDR